MTFELLYNSYSTAALFHLEIGTNKRKKKYIQLTCDLLTQKYKSLFFWWLSIYKKYNET